MLNVPGRMVGFYEAGQNRLASFFVWHDESLDLDGDPAAVLRETFGDLGWEVPAALAAIPPAHEIYLDVVAQVDMPRWHKGRVVLVGDAAYAVSLVAGQGASLALAGGAALGEALADGATIASALETMEARLRPEVLKKQKTGRNMADWFAPRRQWQIGLRDFAFNVLNTPVFAGLLGPLFALDSKGFSARA
jgi:2-polyprenyl-6-methoxyphenol hydroxylase-like FAD-dependent oxidoreductase